MISRLNPTTNGPLHIGHVYNALVNLAESDSMALRFDDNQRFWIDLLGEEAMQEYAKGQLEDLEWMGIKSHKVVYNSLAESVVLQIMAERPRWRDIYNYRKDEPIIVSNPRIEPMGPMFFVTAEKVILDNLMNCDVIIRGLELLQENALYLYLCGIFGYPTPKKMIYIPRLMANDGTELASISKTAGQWKVEDLRAQHVSPEEIMTTLRHACLKDLSGGFTADNLQGAPVLPVASVDEMVAFHERMKNE